MVEELLNGYLKNKAIIQLNEIKLNQITEDLKLNAIELDNKYSKREYAEPGMPKSMHISSPTEEVVIRAEKIRKNLNSQLITIKDKVENTSEKVKKVELLLSSLTEEERFLIERRYFEKEKEYVITQKFNQKYRASYNAYITTHGIRKKIRLIVVYLDS